MDLIVEDGAMTSQVRFSVRIFRTPPSLEEFTLLVYQEQAFRWDGWKAGAQQAVSMGGFPAIEAGFNVKTELGPMVGKIRTAMRGRLGFVLLTGTQASQADSLETTFATVMNRFILPQPDHPIPLPTVVGTVVTSDFEAGLPTGNSNTFERETKTIFAISQTLYLPVDSALKFDLLRLDSDASQAISEPEVGEQGVGSSPLLWASWSREDGWPSGFYRVIVTTDDEQVMDSLPFTIVREEGNEFDDATMYLTWAKLLIADGDFERATYALSKAVPR